MVEKADGGDLSAFFLSKGHVMTTMRATKYPTYAATYDYTTDKGWSMSFEERTEIAQRARQCRKAGDMEEYDRLMKQIPLEPNLAWMLRDRLGKKEFLEEGYNLKDAEIAYGKNWVDEYRVICNNEGYWNE